jgi:hypothetical protein
MLKEASQRHHGKRPCQTPSPHPLCHQTASNDLYYHPRPGIRRCWCGQFFLPTIMRTSPSHVHQPCIGIGIITVEASACPRRAILSLESIINTRHGRRLAAIRLWVARRNRFGALIKKNNHCLVLNIQLSPSPCDLLQTFDAIRHPTIRKKILR